MKSRAVWMLERFGVDESLIGDLIEQYRGGRSPGWLWRQVIVAIAASAAARVRRDRAVIAVSSVVVAVAVALPYVWMSFLWHYVSMVDNAWYPRSINWLAQSSPDALWRVVVFLHPWAWTSMSAWCAVLALATWVLVRLWRRRAKLIFVVFALAIVSQTAPSLARSFIDGIHEPTNPVWISSLAWNVVFDLVAMPLSMAVGWRIGERAPDQLAASTN